MGALGYRECLIDPPLVGSHASAHLPLLTQDAAQTAPKVIAFAWKGRKPRKSIAPEEKPVVVNKNSAFAVLEGLSFATPHLQAKGHLNTR
jgi:hypothetical protein